MSSSDTDFIQAIQHSDSWRELAKALDKSISGASVKLLQKRAADLNVDTSHFLSRKKGGGRKHTTEKLLTVDSNASSSALKNRLLAEGFLENVCSECGQLPEWNNKPLVLQLDHINGQSSDNRIENLAPACAVCNQRRGKHKADRTAKLKRGKHITAHGVTMCEADWSRHLGVSRAAFKYRFERGDSLDEAMRPRVGSSGPNTGRSRVPLRDLFVISEAL